jgi:F0F1-type ATP synthase assembly protein I
MKAKNFLKGCSVLEDLVLGFVVGKVVDLVLDEIF